VPGLTTLLANYQIPYDTIFWVVLHNTGHTPFFGIISLLILGISLHFVGERLRPRTFHYLLALGVTAILGLVSEYIQIAGPRDADPWDFVRDVAGAVSFLGLYMARDRRVLKKARIVVVAFASCVLIASLVPLAYWTTAHVFRNAALPVICDFESYWTSRFVGTRDAEFRIVDSPPAWNINDNRVVAIEYEPANFSEFVVREPYPDWRGYGKLLFDVFYEEDSTIHLTVRIEDSAHNGDYNDRFNRAYAVQPEPNRISIPLTEIEKAPATRDMAMCSIKAIRIFAVGLKGDLTVYIDNIRLE